MGFGKITYPLKKISTAFSTQALSLTIGWNSESLQNKFANEFINFIDGCMMRIDFLALNSSCLKLANFLYFPLNFVHCSIVRERSLV